MQSREGRKRAGWGVASIRALVAAAVLVALAGFAGGAAAADVPGAPTSLMVTPGDGTLELSWLAPTDTGMAPITDYAVEYSQDGMSWTLFGDGTSTDTEATIDGLTNGTSYFVRVAAVNSFGAGPFSMEVEATPGASSGYILLEENGDLFGFGPARDLLRLLDPNAVDLDQRSTTFSSILRPQVGTAKALDIASTADGEGFWVLLDTGVILHQGSAPAYPPLDLTALDKMVRVSAGSTTREPEKLIAMSALPDDTLWAFSTAGRVLPAGTTLDADTVMDMDAILDEDLDGPMVGSTATVTGAGAYLTATDGGVFALGDAVFIDSVRGQIEKRDGVPGLPTHPVTDIVPDPDGTGYYVAAIDGGVFAIDAPFVGSLPAIVPFDQLFAPINGMVTFGDGYLLVASDGGVFDFSGTAFQGSASGLTTTPIVAITPI